MNHRSCGLLGCASGLEFVQFCIDTRMLSNRSVHIVKNILFDLYKLLM